MSIMDLFREGQVVLCLLPDSKKLSEKNPPKVSH